jgi:hypothetical protein
MRSDHRKAGGSAVIYTGLRAVFHNTSSRSGETSLFFMYFMKRRKHRKAAHINIMLVRITTKLFIFILPVFIMPVTKRAAIILLQI